MLQVLQQHNIFLHNVAAPDTGKGVVRDDAGRIIGTKRLVFMCSRKD